MNLISKEKCRSFRRFIKFSWFLFLCFMTHAQTSIMISGNFSEEKQVTIFNALRKITWSFEDLETEEQKNNPPEPFEDVKRVQEYLDANHITATAAYVPTTVWDLYFIYKYFKDAVDNFQEKCESIWGKNSRSELMKEKEFPKIYFQVSQELSNRMHTHQKNSSQRDLAFFTRFGEAILELIATEITVETLFADIVFIEPLLCEHKKIKNNEGSLILEMIRQEYHAAQKNQILLVRATNGLPLLSKALTEQEYRDERRKFWTEIYRNTGTRSPELEEKVEKIVKQYINKDYRVEWFDQVEWFQSFDPEQSVLDFPLKGGFVAPRSAYKGIHDFNKSDDGELLSVDLSYATSLLAGYLYDGVNTKPSGCSFVFYLQNPKLTLYTLSLDKKWFFTEGAPFFHTGDHPFIGILGSEEVFHPRLRALRTAPQPNEAHHKITTVDRLKLEEPFDWNGINEWVKENPEMKKIFQYVLKANEILSSASILSLGGKLTALGGSAAEKAKKMIENQKRCSEVLIEKCSEKS